MLLLNNYAWFIVVEFRLQHHNIFSYEQQQKKFNFHNVFSEEFSKIYSWGTLRAQNFHQILDSLKILSGECKPKFLSMNFHHQ